MLYTLALLAAILCLPSCSEEENKGIEYVDLPFFTTMIFIQDAEGNDLLNAQNEGTLLKGDWRIELNGIVAYSPKSTKVIRTTLREPTESMAGVIDHELLIPTENTNKSTLKIFWDNGDVTTIDYYIERDATLKKVAKYEFSVNGKPINPESYSRIVIVKE